jgi:hypothetical protein
MKIAVDKQENTIGIFDGNVIKDKDNKIIYQIIDHNVLAKSYYADEALQHFNKGQFEKVGEFDGQQCTVDNEIIFEIKEV